MIITPLQPFLVSLASVSYSSDKKCLSAMCICDTIMNCFCLHVIIEEFLSDVLAYSLLLVRFSKNTQFFKKSQISPVISTQWSGHTFHLIKNLCYFGDPPVTLNKSLNANHERICSEINHNLHWSSWKPLATWKHVTSQVRVIVLWELFNHFVHTLHRPSWVCHKLNKPQCSG